MTIAVDGNKLVDEKGNVVILRGVSIADPNKLFKEGQWKEGLFEELVQRWGVNVVRLPIHPKAWRERGESDYLKLIDQAVVWANRRGAYLIVDWHSIGYLPTEKYQRDVYETTIKETKAFWRTIARRYKGVPTTAVYEIFNEPTLLGSAAGTDDWLEWKAMQEELIDIIYAVDRSVIPLVAGFNWAYDLTPVRENPIAREGIAYASHPYPQKEKPEIKSKESYFSLWQKKWGFVAEKYPLIATELGWVQPDGYGAHVPVMDDGSYGPRIIEFMQARGISWTAWVFDPKWSPVMIKDWSFTPSEQGEFFKKVMLESKPGKLSSR